MENKALILLAHGSKNKIAEKEMLNLVDNLLKHNYLAEKGFKIVKHSFLQFSKPFFSDILHELYDAGFKKIYIVPLFVFAGSHIVNDIPEIINNFVIEHPQVVVEIGEYMGKGDYLVEFSLQSLQRSVIID